MTFQKMSDKQQSIYTPGTILKISIISGCPIPEDERVLKILESEMKKFIAENNSFSKLTSEEIVTAFRFNAAGKFDEKIKHWNNMFNLDYLGEILTKYVSLRRSVELKEERELLCINLFKPLTEPKLSDEDAIQFSWDRWTDTKDYMFIESRVYDILKGQGIIKLNDDQKEQIKNKALVKCKNIKRFYYELIEYIGSEKVVNIISKKIAVSEYFISKKESVRIHSTLDNLNININNQLVIGELL